MKKINLIKIVLTLLISVSALTAHAQWAVSVSAGSADYEFAVTENLTVVKPLQMLLMIDFSTVT